jgi:hypothetical protein
MFERRHVDELARIALAGGGFALDCAGRSTDDLVRIALAASGKGSRIVFRGLENAPIDDLARLSLAGKGCVSFE